MAHLPGALMTEVKRRRRTKVQLEAARRRRESSRKNHLATRHHMTPEEYDSLLMHQRGLCYICCRAKGTTRALAVDHNHRIAREDCEHEPEESCAHCWRGLLCSRCNQMLAHARDDWMVFRRAINYLNDPPAQEWMISQ
jgi:hypothetical protein